MWRNSLDTRGSGSSLVAREMAEKRSDSKMGGTLSVLVFPVCTRPLESCSGNSGELSTDQLMLDVRNSQDLSLSQ